MTNTNTKQAAQIVAGDIIRHGNRGWQRALRDARPVSNGNFTGYVIRTSHGQIMTAADETVQVKA